MSELENNSQDITDIENNENITLDRDINLDEDYVLNWDQKEEADAIQDGEAEEVSLGEQTQDSQEVDGGLREQPEADGEYEGESQEEGHVDGVELGQVQDNDDVQYEDEEVEYEDEVEDTDNSLPEEWSKMLDFLDDNPGASPADYVKLTEGFDELSDEQALKMKIASDEGFDPVEDVDEIDFLYDDKYGYDEDLDSERDIRLRKIASKKALKEARTHIDGLKDKYGTDLTFKNESPKHKEALQFQQEQTELLQQNEELATDFQDRTQTFFTQDFKGFEFEYGDGKSQRIKVGDTTKVSESQSDIGNFIGQYLNDDGQISDLKGYHKSLWAAQNADALFSHAYEQGKADAVRSSARNAKNIDMGPRQSSSEPTQQSRFKLEDEGTHTEDFKFNF